MLYSNLSLPETPEKTLWESPAWAERELEQGEEEEKEQGFIYEDEEARMDEGVEEHESLEGRKRRALTPPDTNTALGELPNPPSPHPKRRRVAPPAKKVAQPTKTQGRKTPQPWTNEETTALQKLIEEHGTVWKSLKAIDEENQKILQKRDVSALRVKAQNTKFALLKAGTDLPANFGSIRLYKTMTDKLEKLGIEYTQS